MWTYLWADTLAGGTIKYEGSIAGPFADAFAVIVIENEVGKAPWFPDAFTGTCATIKLLAMRTGEIVGRVGWTDATAFA